MQNVTPPYVAPNPKKSCYATTFREPLVGGEKLILNPYVVGGEVDCVHLFCEIEA